MFVPRFSIRGAARRKNASASRLLLQPVRHVCEALESRVLLSAVMWTGSAGDNNWSTPNNWSGDAVPGASADVTIPGGVTINYTADSTASVNSITSGAGDTLAISNDGDISVAGNASLVNLSVSGRAEFDIDGTATVSGSLTISGAGGIVGGSGTLSLPSGATFTATGNCSLNLTTFNDAATSMVSSTSSLGLSSTTTINNSGTFTLQASFSYNEGTFNNSGTLNASSTTSQTVSAEFNNSGTVNVTSGDLVLNNSASGGGGTETGAFNVSAGAELDFNSDGGTFILNPGTSFTGPGQVDWINEFDTITMNINLTFSNLTLSASLGGTGTLTITNSLAWMDDSYISNTVDIASGATLSITGTSSPTVATTGVINDAGATTLTAFTGESSLGVDGTFNNSGAFDDESDGSINGGGAFNNSGTFTKSTGVSQLIETPMNNSGTVNSNSGDLVLYAGGTETGTFNASAGNELDFSCSVDGATYTLNAGTAFDGPGTFGIIPSFVNVVLNTGITVQNLDFTASYGGITGTGSLSIAGTMTWSGNDTIMISGPINIQTGATLNYTASGAGLSGPTTGGGTLNNFGTIDLAPTPSVFAPLGGFYMLNSVVTNAGTIDIQNDGGFIEAGTINNSGTFEKTAGTGTSTADLAGASSTSLVTFNNTGSVVVSSGSLAFLGNITQLAGTTLSGGTWTVSSGSAIDFPTGDSITTNQATVTLTGAGATFPALAALSANAGSLTLSGGATFSTTGDLANTGTITVGPASTVTVAGAYSQSAAGTLDVQIGGTTASGQFGALASTNPVSLDGTLGIALANGFNPTAGATYPVLTFPSETGAFATIDRISSGAGQLLTVATNPTNVTVTSTGSVSQLAASNVSIPATGTVGQNVTITYTVTNTSSNATNVDSWNDSAYLSLGPTLTTSAMLIGTVAHTGALAGGASYSGTITAPLPGASDGAYHVIVVADSGEFVVQTTRAGDTAVSSESMTVADPALAPGTASTGTIASGQFVYYEIPVTAGASVTVTLTTTSPGGAELYAGYQSVPTLANYAQYSFDPTSATQTLTISGAQAGTYYILVHGRDASGAGASFSLIASVQGYGITNVSPSTGSNQGNVTITVTGSQFTSATTVSLVPHGGGTPLAAATVEFQDNSTVYATFDLAGLAMGLYDVAASTGGVSTTDASAFSVTSVPAGHLVLSLQTPDGIRPNIPTLVTVDYSNTGATDIPAPLLEVTADTASVTLAPTTPSGTTNGGGSYVFLATNPDGPAGTLTPGASGSATFVIETGDTSSTPVTLEVYSLGATSQPFDFASLEASATPPPNVTAAAFSQILSNLGASLGSTTTAFQAKLDADDTYLGQFGEATQNVNALLGFEYLNADAALLSEALGTQTDASVPTPGLSLDFTRQYSLSIDGRYATGPFGQGWTDNFDISATTDSAGNVNIYDDGQTVPFAPQADGSYQSLLPEAGTLTAVSGGGYQLLQTSGILIVFNSSGQLDYEQDTNGNRITAAYNGSAQLTSLTASSGQSLTLAYNSAGLISNVTDSLGRQTTYAYDSSNQYLLSVSTPQGTTQYTYNQGNSAPSDNALTSITLADGVGTFFTYDAQGRLTGTSADGGADATTFAYPQPGEIAISAAGGTSEVFIDSNGELVRDIDALGNTTTIAYDPTTLLPTQITNPLGDTTNLTYDSVGNLLSETDPLGGTSTFTYNADSEITSLTDADGNTTSYNYDGNGNLLSTTLPGGQMSTSAFNPLGEATSFLNANGQAISYAYNANGQLTAEAFPGASYTYAYDAHGNLTSATDATGTTTFTYNAADELTGVAYADGESLQFTLDAGGRRTQMVETLAGSAYTVNYHYNPDGSLAGLTDGSGNSIVAYTYNSAAQLTRTDNGNGTYTTYAYDAEGDVLSIINSAPGGAVNSSFVYTYNAAGEVAAEATINGTWTYGYDAAGQLTAAAFASTNATIPSQNLAYNYNAAGDRTSTVTNGTTTAYTSNSDNEYTSVGGVAYTYDADGNLTSNGVNTFTYNALNELTGVSGGGTTASYTFNALGEQVVSTLSGQTTQFLVDPLLGVEVGSLSAGTRTDITFGLGLVDQAASGSSGATNYFDFGALGSTADLTNSSGAVVNSYAYNPYGSILSSNITVSTLFTFIGASGVSVGAGGLFYMQNRCYMPAVGQFASNDPLGIAGGDTNIRRYVGNSPITNIDPIGLAVGDTPAAGSVPISGSFQPFVENASLTPAQIAVNMETFEQNYNEVLNSPNTNPLTVAMMQLNQAFDSGDAARIAQALENFNAADAAYEQAMADAKAALPSIAELAAGVAAARAAALAAAVRVPLALPNPVAAGALVGIYIEPLVEPILRYFDPILAKLIPKLIAHDPNDLIGPAGYGPQGFVAATQPLNYTVQFENDPTASAAAQTVVVTEQLSSNLDLNTFQLGDIGFGSFLVNVPAGHSSYQTIVNAVSTLDLDVDVSADLNLSTGLVTWTFTSLDPTTLQPTSNPAAGFLPPNDAEGDGEGYVSYSVEPISTAATGTAITGQASVVFDTNAAIATNTVSNTIDASTPTSTVAALPASEPGSQFLVSWSGSDAGGSGIASYSIYVSDNGGAFTPWLVNTPLTSEVYAGTTGNTYAFYSVATSNAGNVQATPASGQASTTAGPLLFTGTITGTAASILAGTKGTALVHVTNGGTSAINGQYTVMLVIGTSSTTIDSADIALAKGLKLRLKLKPGQSTNVKFQFVYPKTLAAGTYNLMASVSTGGLLAGVIAGPAVQVTPAVVDLAPTITALPKGLVTGKIAHLGIAISNSGNVLAKGPVTIAVSASTTQSTTGAQLLATIVPKVSVQPKKSAKYTIAFKPPAAGSYYLSVQLTPGAGIPDTDVSDKVVYSVLVLVSAAPVHK